MKLIATTLVAGALSTGLALCAPAASAVAAPGPAVADTSVGHSLLSTQFFVSNETNSPMVLTGFSGNSGPGDLDQFTSDTDLDVGYVVQPGHSHAVGVVMWPSHPDIGTVTYEINGRAVSVSLHAWGDGAGSDPWISDSVTAPLTATPNGTEVSVGG